MKIGFFGCSMTEGGGLNSPVWNEYAIKNNIISKEYVGRYEKLRDDYRFSTLVGKELNCEVENLALSRNSNENIINQLYEHKDKFDICVVQFSIFTRRYIWNEPENKFYNISGVDFSEHPYLNNEKLKPLHETYLNYVAYHHNEKYVKDHLCRYVDLFDNLGKRIYWIFYQPVPKMKKRSNVLYWNLVDWANNNRLEFRHFTDGFYNDRHLSLKGNELVANKIVKKIND